MIADFGDGFRDGGTEVEAGDAEIGTAETEAGGGVVIECFAKVRVLLLSAGPVP